jgi:hypothetical protein
MTNTNDYRINWKKLSITQEGEGTIVHPLVALALSPIMGLLFLMFLPFIGFYLSVIALGKKVASFVTIPAPAVVGVAYLAGHDGDKPTEKTELEQLDEEIQQRRAK